MGQINALDFDFFIYSNLVIVMIVRFHDRFTIQWKPGLRERLGANLTYCCMEIIRKLASFPDLRHSLLLRNPIRHYEFILVFFPLTVTVYFGFR